MTGSTPSRRRCSGRHEEDGGPPREARDEERGREASLEAPDRLPEALERAEADGPGTVLPASSQPPRGRLTAVRAGMRKGGGRARTGFAYLADRLIETAPRLPVRDLSALRGQFPGLSPEELADRLVAGAANASSTVGAGVGAAAMLPVPLAMPAELAAEVTGVAAIELKLIAELHEVYGLRPPGRLKARSAAYLTSWSQERGIDVTMPSTVNVALGGQMKRELRQRIMKRMARDLPSLVPFMVGAAVGAVMNRRDTRRLAERIRSDLRLRQVAWDELPQLPPLEKPADLLPPGEFPRQTER